MTITTEEAERLAQMHDLVRFTLGMKAPEHDLTSAAFRSLAAERDALTIRYVTEMKARFKAEAEFSHMQRRIARQRRALAKLYAKRHDRNGRLTLAEVDARLAAALQAENAGLRAAFQKYFGQSEATNVRAALGETQ
jgi:hypothetical protein